FESVQVIEAAGDFVDDRFATRVLWIVSPVWAIPVDREDPGICPSQAIAASSQVDYVCNSGSMARDWLGSLDDCSRAVRGCGVPHPVFNRFAHLRLVLRRCCGRTDTDQQEGQDRDCDSSECPTVQSPGLPAWNVAVIHSFHFPLIDWG